MKTLTNVFNDETGEINYSDPYEIVEGRSTIEETLAAVDGLLKPFGLQIVILDLQASDLAVAVERRDVE